jgi:hypothetical protein
MIRREVPPDFFAAGAEPVKIKKYGRRLRVKCICLT